MTQAVQATNDQVYAPATRPTLYFIGVTTGQSSIMTVFPRWADYLGLEGAVIWGVDCRIHDQPSVYRRVVEHIKSDKLSLGALVTTHKIDLLRACRDLFEELDSHAQLLGEVSGISKCDGKLVGHAKDPITSGLALEALLPAGHWERSGAEVLVLGAGGSSLAITCYLVDHSHEANRPSRIVVTNRSPGRLDEMREIHRCLGCTVPIEYRHATEPGENDRLANGLKPGSLVINATGLGKDAPGSPLTSAAVFPKRGYAWDFNYRGNLLFLDQARAQQQSRGLTIEDGWIYFIHGWTRVMAEVFHITIATSGPQFDALSRIAAETRR